MSFRILLVDDHSMFRAGLRLLLESRYPEAELAEAGDGATALERAAELKPDLIILDIHLPDQNGLEVARQILDFAPTTKIIMLSGDASLSFVNESLKAGVVGYVLKVNAPEELSRAMAAVLAGKLYLSPEANASVLQTYRQSLSTRSQSNTFLSACEREVLRFIAEGLRTKEIAARMEVAVKTVETYRRRLTKKLACGSTAELVRYAVREGLIQP